jgi:phosphatidylserine/phosphatidylglycerophosphate/cardiolipin synthase-like enzyme
MKLLIQPEDGVSPLVSAIKKAKKTVDIVIFRFDRAEIEAALKAAAKRGVVVSALIAYANHGGERSLRKLEMRLLEEGVTVTRTAADLSRYHDKMLIIDRRVLYVMSFNYAPRHRTAADSASSPGSPSSWESWRCSSGYRPSALQGASRYVRRQSVNAGNSSWPISEGPRRNC